MKNDNQKISFNPGVAGILQLPDELLLHIRSFLPLTSQACLALTCKTFFSFTGEVLGSREFALPPIEFDNIIGTWGLGHSLRWELLCLLQDARWLICSQCNKLRPIDKFPGRLFLKSRLRNCVYGPHEGIVEICPCIRMSFGDKLKLMDQLETERENPHSNGSPFRHECLTVREGGRVLTQAQPVLQEDGSLVFQMRYSLTTKKQRVGYYLVKDLPICRCPHDQITYTFMRAPWESAWVPRSCYHCETSFGNFTSVKNANEIQYTAQTTRNLGKSRELADKTWFDQCSRHYRVLGADEESKTWGMDSKSLLRKFMYPRTRDARTD